MKPADLAYNGFVILCRLVLGLIALAFVTAVAIEGTPAGIGFLTALAVVAGLLWWSRRNPDAVRRIGAGVDRTLGAVERVIAATIKWSLIGAAALAAVLLMVNVPAIAIVVGLVVVLIACGEGDRRAAERAEAIRVDQIERIERAIHFAHERERITREAQRS